MKIQNIIESDIVVIYGVYRQEINAESFANDIMGYWDFSIRPRYLRSILEYRGHNVRTKARDYV